MSATFSARRLETQSIGKSEGTLPMNVLQTILAYQTFINNEEELTRNENNSQNQTTLYNRLQSFLSIFISQSIPTIFGLFINLLDACTFGTVFFPAYMGNTSNLVVELFLLSTFFSQLILIYFSSFQSALGTSMAENIPFIHSICDNIHRDLKEDPFQQEKLLPTALVAVSLSVVLNGVLFIVLGMFHLGNILHFFPRYVIIGLNAGFGVFLIGTAFEISTGLPMTIASFLLLTKDMIIQIYASIIAEVGLRLLAFMGVNDIILSLIMFFIPAGLFIVLYLGKIPLSDARDHLWLFSENSSASGFHWYNTWDNYLQWENIDWTVIAMQLPTIGLLALFTIVLVPVRIPSLALITNEEVIFDEELIAQGIGNILSGLFGCPHNYLSYSNSIFYYILKGKGRNPRLILCLLTFFCFFIGSKIINYTPRIIASLIMVHLGVDLMISAFFENRRTLTYSEFFCMLFVCIIVVCFGFVMGMCVGILLACVTFVVASSNEQNIRSIFIGNEARSDTQWSGKQEEKLSKALTEQTAQIYVIELQGHLFFGNVQRVISELQEIIDPAFTPASKQDLTRRYSIYGGPRSRAATYEASATLNVHHSSHFSSKASQSYEERFDNHQITKLINVVLDCTFLAGADINALSGLYKFKEKYENHHKKMSFKENDPNPKGSQKSPYDLLSHSPQFQIVFAGLLPSLQEILEIIEQREKEKRDQQNEEKPLELEILSQTNSPSTISLKKRPSSERIPLLSKIASNSTLPRPGSRKYLFNILHLSQTFYFDVNSALHAIEEELLRVIPDSMIFQNQEELIQLMNQEFQMMLGNDPYERIDDDNSSDEYSEFADVENGGGGGGDVEDEKTLDYSQSVSSRSVSNYALDGEDLFKKLSIIVDESAIDIEDLPTARNGNPMTLSSTGKKQEKLRPSPPKSSRKSIPLTRSFSVDSNNSPRISNSIHSPSIQSIRYFNQRKKKLIEYFRQLGSNLWKDYDLPYLEELAIKFLQFPITSYQQEEEIWMKGSEANELGVLLDGKICSLLDNGKSFQTVLPPALIGLSCVVKEKTRTRTLVAIDDDTKIVLIPLSFIENIEEKNRPLHSILVTMALRSLYYRQKSEYSLFHAGSMGNLLNNNK